jgi:hypothetical protein
MHSRTSRVRLASGNDDLTVIRLSPEAATGRDWYYLLALRQFLLGLGVRKPGTGMTLPEPRRVGVSSRGAELLAP